MTSISNLLNLPLKLSSHPDTPSFYDTLFPILNKIPLDLNPHPTDLNFELRELDRLRLKLVTGIHSKSASGRIHINVLNDCLEYYKQLTCCIPKFPIFEIDFSWGNAFQPKNSKTSLPNLYYEKMSVLFNIGIIYCQLGNFQNRTNDQGLKAAGHYFQLSAGIFDLLKNTIENRPNLTTNLPEPSELPTDFSHYSLDFLIHLNLAQAQECFWQKAVLDQMKNVTIAKLAKQISDYYDRAFTSACHRSVANLFNEPTVNHLQLKKLHFQAAAEYRMSCDSLATNQYGMEVARLKTAQDLVRAANKIGGPIASQAALDDLQSLQQVVERNLTRAEKDNNLIYLDVTPKQVPAINKAPMVKPYIPNEVDNPKESLLKQDKSPLLQNLPPFSLIQAISIYDERRDQLVNRELIHKLNTVDKTYQSIMGQNVEIPSTLPTAQLPSEILMMMDEVMDMGGMQELKDKMKTISNLASQNLTLLDQTSNSVQHIQKVIEERYQEFLGAWDYDAPSEIVDKQTKISQAFSASQQSDQKLFQTITSYDRMFSLLNSPSDDVKAFVFTASPTSTTRNPTINLNEHDIEMIQNEFSKRQQMKIELEQIRQNDTIQTILLDRFESLIANHPNSNVDMIELAQFEPLFQNQMRKYDTFIHLVKQEEEKMRSFFIQNNIGSPLNSPQTQSNGSSDSRIEELKTAFEEFKSCMNHLDQGEKFHTQLNSIISRHQSQVNEFIDQMESDFKEFCEGNPTLLGGEDFEEPDPEPPRSVQQPQSKFIKDESFSYGNHTDFGMDYDMTPSNPLNVPYVKNVSNADMIPPNPLDVPYVKNPSNAERSMKQKDNK